jgi:hypothetical protein
MSADERLIAQIKLILDTRPDEAEVFPPDWEAVGEVNYIYRKDAILCDERDVDRVIESLDRRYPDRKEPDRQEDQEETEQPPRYDRRRVSAGVFLIGLRRLPPVPEVLDFLDSEQGVGSGVATPDHLL